ncbi:MAG: hypothetical protein ACPL4E_05945 [Thermoproteota archaeon]
MNSILEKVRQILENTTNTKYEVDEHGVHLNEKILDKTYREKVSDVLHGKEDQNAIKELWQSDEISRSLHDVQHFPHPINADGRLVVETFLLRSEDLLSQRYRGIYDLVMNEGFLSKGRLTDTDIKKIVEDEELASKYPLTHLLLKKASEIATRISNKYSLKMNIVAGEIRNIIKYHDAQGFYLEVPYHVMSDEEDRIQAIIERASAIREFWREWTRVREEIVYNLGLDDKAFVIRDLVEGMLGLPIWTVMVQLIGTSWGLVTDLKYAGRHQKLSDEQWFDMCGGFVRAELQKADEKPRFRIYSAPIYFGLFLGETMVRVHANSSFKKILDMLNTERINPVAYLLDRSHLDEITRFSPLLADILSSLIDLTERESADSLKITPIQVECIWEPSIIFMVKPIPPHEYSSISAEPDLIDVSLVTEIEYSDDADFPFKVIEAAGKLRETREKFINILKEHRFPF